MKFVAQDFHRPKFVACFKVVNDQAVFENGVNARLLGKLTQQTVIMFWRNVDQYFHGATTINLRESPVRVISWLELKNIWWLSFCVDPVPVAEG